MTTSTTTMTGTGVIIDGMGNEWMDADFLDDRYEARKIDHPLVAKAYHCINCTVCIICIAVKTQAGFSFPKPKLGSRIMLWIQAPFLKLHKASSS